MHMLRNTTVSSVLKQKTVVGPDLGHSVAMLDKMLHGTLDTPILALSHEVHFVNFYNNAPIYQGTLAKLLSCERDYMEGL